MRRKTADELMKAGNKAAARRRRAEESARGAGEPVRSAGLARATRNAWNSIVKEYRNVLLKSDAELLLELIAARAEVYRGAGERKETARIRVKEIEAKLSSRKPVEIPEPKIEQDSAPSAVSLADFIAACAQARASFSERLTPASTIMQDERGAFEWADDDPTTRARSYAQRCVQGGIPACDLHQRACARFLDDLEHAHERGIYFDPLAARNIALWFSLFLNRPLFDWQLFVVVNVMGFRRPSGLRRFLECWLWLARQNGKSSLSAGLGLFFLLCDGEETASIYSAATTADQAGIIFRDAKRLVKKSLELKGAIKSYRASLTVEETDSVFQPLSSEVSSLDGLRPSLLACDEIHEWDAIADGRSQWSKLTSGMVSRKHPLTLAISTAGGKQLGFGWEKYAMVKKILTRVVTAEDVFCCVWELPDEFDYKNEKLWIMANPSLGDAEGLKIAALRRQFAETEADPSALSSFLRYQLSRWVSFARQGTTFSLRKVDECRGYPQFPRADARDLYTHFLEHNTGRPSFGGYDYGEVSDLACLALLYPDVRLENGDVLKNRVLIAEFWTPAASVQQHEKEWGVPLSTWVRDGWVKTCDGDMNDHRTLKKDFLEIINLKQQPSGFSVFNIRSIGYDPWHSRDFCTSLSEETSIECVEVKPMPSTMTPVAVAFKTAILSGQLWHLGNPVVRWMLQNVILERSGKYDAIVPEKRNRTEKIDAIQAALSAWSRMNDAPPPSVYSTRGIITLDSDFTKWQQPQKEK